MKTLAIFIFLSTSVAMSFCGSPETNNPNIVARPAATTTPAQPQSAKRKWTEVDLTVNGVRSGTKEGQIIKLLGKPLSIKDDRVLNECVGGYHRDLIYEDLEIGLLSDERRKNYTVWRIEVKSPKWEISPGLRIGDPISKVRELYGEPVGEENDTVSYVSKENLGMVAFKHSDGKIVLAFLEETLC